MPSCHTPAWGFGYDAHAFETGRRESKSPHPKELAHTGAGETQTDKEIGPLYILRKTMSDECDKPGDEGVEPKDDQSAMDLFDPWQHQFISSNKRNDFRKALEDKAGRQ